MANNRRFDDLHREHRQRLRARFLDEGLNAFDDHQTLELLLFYAIPRIDTNETAHKLVQHFGSLSAVLEASYEELLAVDGVGEASASLIRLCDDLCVRRRRPSLKDAVHLNAAELAGEYFLSRFYTHQEETLLIACLNARRRLIHDRVVCYGTAWRACTPPARIADIALRKKAVSVILAHNHPSGYATPSPEDLAFTLRVRDALTALDIELSDHIIVADCDYVSMTAGGYLTPCKF